MNMATGIVEAAIRATLSGNNNIITTTTATMAIISSTRK